MCSMRAGDVTPPTNLSSNDFYDAIDRAAVWDKTNGICWYCGLAMNPFANFSVDHVIPRRHGGTNSPDNLVPCCIRCNKRKGARTLEEFRRLHNELVFSPGQTQFLKEHGFTLPPIPPHQFWFERRGQGE